MKSLAAVSLVAVSIIAFTFTGSALADSHNIPPISMEANQDSYVEGDTVTITGMLNRYDPTRDTGKSITVQVSQPDTDTRVFLHQITPGSDGAFAFNFKVGGPLWAKSGDYTAKIFFDGNERTALISYTAAEIVAPPPVETPPAPPPVETPPAPPPVETPPAPPPVETPPAPPPPPPPVDVEPAVPSEDVCGSGTEFVDGQCQAIQQAPPERIGCLIATAAYGSELAPQVQMLREIRDGTLMTTESGMSFLTAFNQVYYSFSPAVADMERENPIFREAVRALITPMLHTLSIMSLADKGSEAEVLGLGITVIALNLAMYIAAPALTGLAIHRKFRRQSPACLETC